MLIRRLSCFVFACLFMFLSACTGDLNHSSEKDPTSSTVSPNTDSTVEKDDAPIFLSNVEIADALSNVRVTDSRTHPRCAVDHLRESVVQGLWFSVDVHDNTGISALEAGKRNLDLVLKETSDIESVSIRWYQGGTDAENIVDEKDRNYLFYIEASKDGREWECIYPEDYELNHVYARSSADAEVETYPCNAEDVNYIRIVGAGCIDPDNPANNKYFAIRSVYLGGEMKGQGGGDVSILAKPLKLHPYNNDIRDFLKTDRKVTVYFFRHGESDYTIETNKTAGLTEYGTEQTEKIASYFTDSKIPLDAVYMSPYQRCVETAVPLAFSLNLEPRLQVGFYERTISNKGDTIPEGFATAQWDDYRLKLVGGESLSEVEERMACGLKEVFTDAEKEELDCVAVSTHAMALSVLLNCYSDSYFTNVQGRNYYYQILSMDTPCVKCVFEDDELTFMEFIDIGLIR